MVTTVDTLMTWHTKNAKWFEDEKTLDRMTMNGCQASNCEDALYWLGTYSHEQIKVTEEDNELCFELDEDVVRFDSAVSFCGVK